MYDLYRGPYFLCMTCSCRMCWFAQCLFEGKGNPSRRERFYRCIFRDMEKQRHIGTTFQRKGFLQYGMSVFIVEVLMASKLICGRGVQMFSFTFF